jgi:hypothetical protein
MLTIGDVDSVLAAVTGEPSTCDSLPDRCDVDGTSEIDIVDAANVLRRAFGLPGASSCP